MLLDFKAIDQELPVFFASMIFIFGALVGSFLNVCIYRIPAKKSIVHPGSACACGKPIKWYDNIPIFSWFILRGKARCCNAPYSFRYPFIELLTAGLFLATWLLHPHAKAACLLLFISLLICATFIDLDHMEIPDRFSYGAALFGTILSITVPSLHGFQDAAPMIAPIKGFFEAIIGIMIGSGLILWIALASEAILRKEAMGFGDVKLLGGIGAFAGWQGAVFALFGGAVIGTIGLGIWLFIKALIPGLRKNTDNNEEDSLVGKQMPFGPMLAAGALLYLLLLEKEVDQYFAIAIELVQQK